MIRQLLNNELSSIQKEAMYFDSDVTQGMLKALETSVINNDNGIGLPYWSKQNPAIVKDITFVLVQLGYAKVIASRKYSRLEFNLYKLDAVRLKEWRLNSKISKFLMREDTKEYPNNLVKSNGKIKETGLVRNGFAKVAKNNFKLDIEMLQMYYEPIKQTLIKSMRKSADKGMLKDKYFADESNYEHVVKYVLDAYMKDGTYNLEANISDSRGRSIYKALKRIGNPVSSKDFRALLVMPTQLVHHDDHDKLDDAYYFIAELLGSKAKSETTKIAQGKRWFNMRKLPEVDLETEHGRDELHELIWLTRIYNKLERLQKIPFVMWDVPVEIDASMSIAQVVGALTNEHRLLERTNVIGSTLTDPWHINGVKRASAKAVGTPTFYGSSQSAVSLIRSKNLLAEQVLLKKNPNATEAEIATAIAESKLEIKAIRKEFSTGGLAVMKMFKDAVIKNYNMHEPIIPMKIWNDNFHIEVNKFKPAGAEIIVTEAWNGKKYVKSFTHEPILVPDYDHMKLFWATCLIHNLDSQCVDNIADHIPEWMLTIHDAVICGLGTAKRVRNAYALQLKEININRNSIISNFRKSIGATDIKSDIAFMKLYEAIQQAEATPFNASAMK